MAPTRKGGRANGEGWAPHAEKGLGPCAPRGAAARQRAKLRPATPAALLGAACGKDVGGVRPGNRGPLLSQPIGGAPGQGAGWGRPTVPAPSGGPVVVGSVIKGPAIPREPSPSGNLPRISVRYKNTSLIGSGPPAPTGARGPQGGFRRLCRQGAPPAEVTRKGDIVEKMVEMATELYRTIETIRALGELLIDDAAQEAAALDQLFLSLGVSQQDTNGTSVQSNKPDSEGVPCA